MSGDSATKIKIANDLLGIRYSSGQKWIRSGEMSQYDFSYKIFIAAFIVTSITLHHLAGMKVHGLRENNAT